MKIILDILLYLTPMGANKIKLRLENTQNSEKELNIIEVNLDKK